MSKKNYRKQGSGNNKTKSFNSSSKTKSSYPKREGISAPKVDTRESLRMVDVVSNAVEYYNKYPNDFKAASSLAWYQIMGRPIPMGDIVYDSILSHEALDERALPGIMTINFLPTIGIAHDQHDAANRAFAQMMADMYAKTSGSNLGFQQADLAMLLICMSSISCLIAHARRALSTVDFWISKNINYPKALTRALGFDWNNLTKNKNQYISRLNSLIHQFNNIKMPKFLDIFQRHFGLCHNVYVDEDSSYGQIYVFKPKGYYLYSDTESMARLDTLSDYYADFGSYLDIIQNALDYWYNSSDLYTINGALIRCYKDAPYVFIDDVTDSSIINPACDKTMLMQIMNMDIIQFNNLKEESLNITQDAVRNTVIFQPITKDLPDSHTLGVPHLHMLRVFHDDPTPEDNAEMTRLCVTYETDYNGITTENPVTTLTSCGAELVCGVTIYGVSASDVFTPVPETEIESNFYALELGIMENQEHAFNVIGSLQPFRYVPFVPMYDVYHTCAIPCGDIYNYTFVDQQTMSNLNNMCNYSLWKVDSI